MHKFTFWCGRPVDFSEHQGRYGTLVVILPLW